MRLLLDVHHSRRAAARLRDDDWDVLAASDDPALAKIDDEDLLRWAAVERRTLVTENAKDFDRIVRAWAAVGEHHGGVIFTSPRRFHRGWASYPEDLVRALAGLLASELGDNVDWVHWV